MKKRIISLLTAVFIFISCLIFEAEALTPTYTVSDTYKSSVFYERLTSVELTGDQRRDIVNVAISQLGYHEGDSRSDFDGGNQSGTDNYTEFNYANRSTLDGNGSYAWCASFVTFCARQAGVPTKIIMNSVLCDSFVANFKSTGNYKTRASGYKPVAGDLIFFLYDGANRTYASHIGIVVGNDGNSVYTIEGNTSRGIVNCRSYSLGNTNIVGYAVPSYTGTSGDYSDFELRDGYVEPGVYKVTSATLNFRASPSSTTGTILKTLTLNTEITITEASGDWGKTIIGGKSGWVSLKYVVAKNTSRYKITYNANSGGTAPGQTLKYAGVDVKLSDIPAERFGNDFLGWAKTPDAEQAEYQPGDTYSENADITLYAVWKAQPIKVEFFDDDGSVISSHVYGYGDRIEIPENPINKTDENYNYEFQGWNVPIISVARADRSYTAVYTATEIVRDTTAAVRVMAEVAENVHDVDVSEGCESTDTPIAIANAVSVIVLILGTGIVFTIKTKL